MGLDIIAYSNMTLIKDANDSDFDEENSDLYLGERWREGDYLYKLNENYQSDTWKDGVYIGGYNYSFRAGSYTGVEEWMNYLSLINQDNSFDDLLNYNECEGFIGPNTSKKLYEAFINNFEKARQIDKFLIENQESIKDWFLSKYIDWMTAFKIASNYGAVRFG